jgi:hypothetical protein
MGKRIRLPVIPRLGHGQEYLPMPPINAVSSVHNSPHACILSLTSPIESQTLNTASAEQQRLSDDAARKANWKRWGPYLAERQWGTVREDYSQTAHAGIISRTITPAPAPIAGARMACSASPTANAASASRWRCGMERSQSSKSASSALTNPQGNHGEDVKELYFYLDSTPTHSYMKALYKYPHGEFPYARLGRGEPAARSRRARV